MVQRVLMLASVSSFLLGGCFSADPLNAETDTDSSTESGTSTVSATSTSTTAGTATTNGPGTSATNSTSNGPTSDGPTSDGPTSEGPTSDGPTGSTDPSATSTTADTEGSGTETGDPPIVSCSTSIAFLRTNDIWMIELDGLVESNLSNHAAADREFDWSPDGSELTFVSTRANSNGEVYRVTTAGSVSPVTSTEPSPAFPQWTGDGSRIVFMADTTGNAFTGYPVSILPDGSGRMEPASTFMFLYGGFVLNPVGDTGVNVDSSNGPGRLLRCDVASGSTAYLTSATENDLAPQYSPNGAQIVFERRVAEIADIAVVSSTGTGLVNLTDTFAAPAHRPRWSPDGSRILFVADIGGDEEVFVMESDGSNPTNLSNAPGVDSAPVFSPDGLKIAFVSDRDGSEDIWVMNADGSEQAAITSTNDDDSEPGWQPCAE